MGVGLRRASPRRSRPSKRATKFARWMPSAPATSDCFEPGACWSRTSTLYWAGRSSSSAKAVMISSNTASCARLSAYPTLPASGPTPMRLSAAAQGAASASDCVLICLRRAHPRSVVAHDNYLPLQPCVIVALARRAHPTRDSATATVTPAYVQRPALGAAAFRCPCRPISVWPDGERAARVAEPQGYDAVAGLGPAPRERLSLGRASGWVVVGPTVGLGRRRIGDGAIILGNRFAGARAKQKQASQHTSSHVVSPPPIRNRPSGRSTAMSQHAIRRKGCP